MIPTEQVEKLKFKKLIVTIGNLPSSYVESLSYYECILWLCNYLQNTVIPAINNNGEAVEELQELFVELKNYVDGYLSDEHIIPLVNAKIEELINSGEIYVSLGTEYDDDTERLDIVLEALPSEELIERLATLATPEGSA